MSQADKIAAREWKTKYEGLYAKYQHLEEVDVPTPEPKVITEKVVSKIKKVAEKIKKDIKKVPKKETKKKKRW